MVYFGKCYMDLENYVCILLLWGEMLWKYQLKLIWYIVSLNTAVSFLISCLNDLPISVNGV